MGHQSVVAAVEHRVVVAQPVGDVVRRQHGDGGGPSHPLGAHHAHVGPRDRQDPGGPVRRGADRADALTPLRVRVHGVAGEVRREMLAHRDRAHPRAPAAVRDAERLVQVQVRHVAAELPRLGVAEQRVEVRPVDVDLPTVLVDDPAQLGDPVLVRAVGRGVGDHDRGQVVAVLLALRRQVLEVDRPVLGCLHHDHAHAGHHRRGGVGAVGRGRDQADVARPLAAGDVVATDGQQAGELALGTGVGLQGDPVVAGDLREPSLELGDQGVVPRGVLGRGEGVQVGEPGEADGLHLGGGVQLHRAGPERDHPPVEREVTRREPTQVAQHRGLGPVAVEHLMGEEVALPGQRLGQGVAGAPVRGLEVDLPGTERRQDRLEVLAAGGLGGGDADVVRVDEAQVHAPGAGGRHHGLGAPGYPGEDGVEELVVDHLDARLAQRLGERYGVPVGALRDRAQPVGAVVDGVHRGRHGEEHLRGADVRGRLVTADVLLAGLQREPVRGTPLGVDRDAHEATGQVALDPGADRHVAGVRAAVEQRNTEPLRGADDDVGAHRAGRLQDGEGEQVRGHHGHPATFVHLVDERTRVRDVAGGTGVLHEHAADLTVRKTRAEVGDLDLDAHRAGTGADDLDGLRERVGVHDEPPGGLAVGAAHQRHRLSSGGPLVEQRGVRGRQPGEVADHGLEVQQRLEASLRDLGLVGRVRRVPARVLQHVAAYDGRRDRAVVAQADHRLEGIVAGRGVAGEASGFLLPHSGREVERRGSADPARDGRVHEVLEGGEPERPEHGALIALAGADVPIGEHAAGVELGQGGLVGHGGSRWQTRSGRLPLCRAGARTVLQSCLVRAVLAPERFRGGLPLRRSATRPVLVGTETLPRGFVSSYTLPHSSSADDEPGVRGPDTGFVDSRGVSRRCGHAGARRARRRPAAPRRPRARWAARRASPRSRARHRRSRCRRRPGLPGAGR